MSKNTQLAAATANAQANALARLLDNGYLTIYNGTQPATADTAVSTQTQLAQLRFNATSAPGASGGILTFNAMTPDNSAENTGTASWFRATSSDGVTVVMDGSAGATGSNSNLELSTSSIVAGAKISVTSFTHTVELSASGL